MGKIGISSGITGLTTIYPGTVRTDFLVTASPNNNVTADFVVGVSVGNASLGKWYDVGYYNDGKGCTIPGQNPSAYVCMTLNPGQTASDFRTIDIPNDPDIKDVYVTVRRKDTMEMLGDDIRYDVLTVTPIVEATIAITNIS